MRDIDDEEVSENEVLVPYEFWHYTTSWVALKSYYRAGLNKSAFSILDYRRGNDFCISKTGKITQLYEQEATPIFDETDPRFDEYIAKIESHIQQPIITIPTERELNIFAQKIEEAASLPRSTRTQKLGRCIAVPAVHPVRRPALVPPAPVAAPELGGGDLTPTLPEEDTSVQESNLASKPSIERSPDPKRATNISNDRIEDDDEQLAEEQTDAAPPAPKPLEQAMQDALEPVVGNTPLPLKWNLATELRNKILQVSNRDRQDEP